MSKIIIFSAPSGSGKSTVINGLMKRDLNLAFSISCTSRAPRGEEQHGIHYYYLTTDEFKHKIQGNEFIEYEEVYAGCFYGTLKSEIERLQKEGKNVIFDVDVIGGLNIKKIFGEEALSVFIQPPSMEILRYRLENRKTDSKEVIEQRLAKAEYELSFAPQFDKIVVTTDAETAIENAYKIIKEFINS